MRRFSCICVLAASTACGSKAPASGVVGTEADAHVAAGTYDGYRVIRPCPSGYSPLAIKGTGSRTFHGVDDISAWATSRLAPLMAGDSAITSIGGVSLGCEDAVGASIQTNDWKDVDGLTVRIGQMLKLDDVTLEISIQVQPLPVAD